MRYDPDLYGPPEEGNEDPAMDDEWEGLLEDTDPGPYMTREQYQLAVWTLGILQGDDDG